MIFKDAGRGKCFEVNVKIQGAFLLKIIYLLKNS